MDPNPKERKTIYSVAQHQLLCTFKVFVTFKSGATLWIGIAICSGHIRLEKLSFHWAPVQLFDKSWCAENDASLRSRVTKSPHPKSLVEYLTRKQMNLSKGFPFYLEIQNGKNHLKLLKL